MKNDKGSSNATHGMGFWGFLALIFITLKLLHVIEWSWIWVLAPLWGGFLISTAIIVVGAIIIKWIVS